MMLVTVVVAASVTGAVGAVRAAELDYRNSKVFYAAEAGAEAIMSQLHDALEDAALDSIELASVTPPSLPGFSFGGFSVKKVGGVVVERVTDGAFAGLYSLTQRVEIHSDVTDQGYNNSAVVVSAKAQAIPIFQFGVFFEQDLEVTNGPPMEFAGWVHSNGNIYASSKNAWYRDAITTPNMLIHDRKDANNVYNGVYVNDASGNEIPLDFDSRTIPDPAAFRAESDAKFDNRVKTNAYGVDTLSVPLPTGMPPIVLMQPRQAGDVSLVKKAKFAWKADWYVDVDLNTLNNSGTNLCQSMTSVRDGGEAVPSKRVPSRHGTAVRLGSWQRCCSGDSNLLRHVHRRRRIRSVGGRGLSDLAVGQRGKPAEPDHYCDGPPILHTGGLQHRRVATLGDGG
jgi:hypothetical protein